MKETLEPGDEVVVHALDRLGRNKEAIKEELAWFKEQGVIVRILNVPTTLIEYPEGQEWVTNIDNKRYVVLFKSCYKILNRKIRVTYCIYCVHHIISPHDLSIP